MQLSKFSKSGPWAHFLFAKNRVNGARAGMGPIEKKLISLLTPTLTSMSYELVGIEYHAQGKHSLLRIYIDKPEGITLEDCQEVSHQASGLLDVEDLINGQYSLEVSSPGLERPLFTLEHFRKYVGQKVKLRLQVPLAGQRNYQGVIGEIDEADDSDIQLILEGDTELRVRIEEIDKANLVADL